PGLLVASLEVLLVPLAVDVPPAPLVAWFEAPPAEFAEVRAPVLDVGPAVGDEPVVSSSTSLFVEPHAARHVPSHRYATMRVGRRRAPIDGLTGAMSHVPPLRSLILPPRASLM